MVGQRETEVLDLLVKEGLSNKIIAWRLGISENTVKVHVRNAMDRLNVRSRLQLVLKLQDNKPMADEPEDYSNYPKSLTEIKSEKESDGSRWTPRDALISALRQIDSGEIKPESLIIAWDEPETSGVFVSCETNTKAVGVLAGASYRLLNKLVGY